MKTLPMPSKPGDDMVKRFTKDEIKKLKALKEKQMKETVRK
jgi:phage gp36-like protein